MENDNNHFIEDRRDIKMINNFNKKENFLTFFFMRGLLLPLGFTCVFSFADVRANDDLLQKNQQQAHEAYQKAKACLEERTRESDQLAFNLMHYAAGLGLDKAMYMLGRFYENGEGTKKNLKRAFLWYEAAAKRGHPKALMRAGFFEEQGLIGKKDKDKAKEYYNKVLEYLLSKFGGDFQSLVEDPNRLYMVWQEVHYRLGVVHEHPQEGPPDNETAFKHYKQGADAGHIRCQIQTAVFLHYGKGVKRDLKRARAWLKKVIDNPKANPKQREKAEWMLQKFSNPSNFKKTNCRDTFNQKYRK